MKFKRFLSTLLAVVMVVSLIPLSVPANATSYTSNDAISWLQSKEGQAIDYDGDYGAQCVDLVMAYYKYLIGWNVGGNGCDYATNTLPTGWTRTKGGQPQKGDILVYAGGTKAGHVAIYESDYITWHQNWGGQYVRRITNRHYTDYTAYDGATYWGCIHPDFSGKSITNTLVKDKQYDAYYPIKAYTLSTSNVQTYKSDLVSTNGSIYKGDLCTIDAIYTNGWCKVTFPLDAGGTRTSYVKLSVFFSDSTPTLAAFRTGSEITTYTRKDLSTKLGYTGKGDTVYKVGTSGSNTQILYPLASGGYKLGWIKTSQASCTHTYGSWTTTKAATCATTGTKEQKCTVCGTKNTATIAATGNHTAGSWKTTKEATCTTAGTKVQQCTSCGQTVNTATIAATGHSYSYKATKAPTTSATGTLTGTCAKCSGTTTVTLPKLSTADYTYEATKAATCEASGTGRYTWKTTTYGSFYFDVTIPATGHTYTNKVTAPTCTAQGYTTHTCSCGYSYKDSYTNATGHSYSYKVTKAPTTSATGTLTGTCSKCSGTTTVTLPKLNTTDYTYKVTKEPSYTATGTGRYTWKTTTYGTFYFDITLDKLTATLTKIEVASKPTKMVYEMGESLDITGLTLKATYSDGSTKTVTSGFTTSGFDSSTAGEKTVTVTYEGKSTSLKVTVVVTEEVNSNMAQIVVDSSTASCGNTVEIDVRVVNNPGFSVLNVAFIYDTKYLTLIELENQLPSVEMNYGTTVVWEADENYSGNGVVCTLKFEIGEDAPEGEYEIQVLFISASDDEFEELKMSGVSGILEICNVLYGDVNGDGKIASVDLAMLRKYLTTFNPVTGVSSVAVKAGADCNGDGKITSVDLAMLRKYLTCFDPTTGESTVVLGPR